MVITFQLRNNGQSLKFVFRKQPRFYSLQNLYFGNSEFQYSKYFINRDIKPDNFLMGKALKERAYLIDFTFAKRYILKDVHITEKIKQLKLECQYASIINHIGVKQNKRDDLEYFSFSLDSFFKRISSLAKYKSKYVFGPSQQFQFVDYTKYEIDEKPDYQLIKYCQQ